MTIGTAVDILARVKQTLSKGWFKWVAPYRDAVIGGLSDSASWNYGLVIYARAQTRLATAYGLWLDILSFDFLGRFLTRNGSSDDVFRAVIRATILQERVTRKGMISAILALTGNTPGIFEPWNTFDTGAYSGTDGIKYGSMGYGVGRGGYGNMNLPGQVFINITRGSSSGVPNVDGYGNPSGGYGAGRTEYTGPLVPLAGVTNAIINAMVNMTKPTGSTAWIAIGGSPNPGVRRPCIFGGLGGKTNSQNIVII
jgi:hypothetical protein